MRDERSSRSLCRRSACRRSAASSPSSSAFLTASGPCAGAEERCSMSHSARRTASPVSVWPRSASRSARSACAHDSSSARSCSSAPLARLACRALVCRRPLCRGDQPVPFISTGEHALGAALGELTHLAPRREPDATLGRGGDAGEVARQILEALDHPRVGEQSRGELEDLGRTAHQLQQPAGARDRRLGAARLMGRGAGGGQLGRAAPCRRRGRRGRAAPPRRPRR